jgi:hypothetical protein
MSHAAKQIRDWFKGACTGVAGLPNATEGTPRQIPENTDACYVRTTTEEILRQTSHTPALDQRTLTVLVTLIANTHTEVDALSVLAEEAIEAEPAYPGGTFEPLSREYEENNETDRAYVALTLTYAAVYSVARNDVETIEG